MNQNHEGPEPYPTIEQLRLTYDAAAGVKMLAVGLIENALERHDVGLEAVASLVADAQNAHKKAATKETLESLNALVRQLQRELAEQKDFAADCARADKEMGRELIRQRDEWKAKYEKEHALATKAVQDAERAYTEKAAAVEQAYDDCNKMIAMHNKRISELEQELEFQRKLTTEARVASEYWLCMYLKSARVPEEPMGRYGRAIRAYEALRNEENKELDRGETPLSLEEQDEREHAAAVAAWGETYAKARADGDRFVIVELRLPIVMHYPKDWDNNLIEFHMGGGSSSCGSNWLEHVVRTFEISGCMCDDEYHVVCRDATPDEADRGIVIDPYEAPLEAKGRY